jgi:hypothetical protein
VCVCVSVCACVCVKSVGCEQACVRMDMYAQVCVKRMYSMGADRCDVCEMCVCVWCRVCDCEVCVCIVCVRAACVCVSMWENLMPFSIFFLSALTFFSSEQ